MLSQYLDDIEKYGDIIDNEDNKSEYTEEVEDNDIDFKNSEDGNCIY